MESNFKTAGWVIFICILIAGFCVNDNGGATLENGEWTIRAQSYLEVGTIGINLGRFGTDVYNFAKKNPQAKRLVLIIIDSCTDDYGNKSSYESKVIFNSFDLMEYSKHADKQSFQYFSNFESVVKAQWNFCGGGLFSN
jgi:hypothetical protein